MVIEGDVIGKLFSRLVRSRQTQTRNKMNTLQEILDRNKAKQQAEEPEKKEADDNKSGKEDKVPAGGKTLTGQEHNEIDLEPTVIKQMKEAEYSPEQVRMWKAIKLRAVKAKAQAARKRTENREKLEEELATLEPLKEAAGRKLVFTFGRMNPPTVGHQKLVEAVTRIAKEIGGKPMVFLSKTQDKKKNPIPYAHKLHYAQEAFGSVVKPLPKAAATAIDILREYSGKYDQICMVVGSDRVPEFKKLLEKYNGKEYNFDKIEVLSAGERDPDSEGVDGMSASKLREAAMSGNFKAFKKGLPHAIQALAVDIYRDVRLEELDLEGMELTEALDAQQRMKRAIQFRRIKARVEAGRKRAIRRRAPKNALTKRARRTAIKFMRKRLTRGTSYGEMSYGQRAQVDMALAKRKKSIGRIAQRLMPKIVRAEATRKLGSNFKGISNRVNEENLYSIVEQTMQMVAEEYDYEFTPIETEVLEAKAELNDLPFDVIERVYRRGIAAWAMVETDLTFQQYAFNRVNSFINGGAAYDMDFDLLDESPEDEAQSVEDAEEPPAVHRQGKVSVVHRTENRPGRAKHAHIKLKIIDEETLDGMRRRYDMPQLTHFHDFQKDIEDSGHRMKEETRKPSDLSPTQKHFNQEKVDKLIADKAHTSKPIIVSADDHIIDGHHRWKACEQAGCDVKTRKVSLKADELLDFVKGKPYVERKGLSETVLTRVLSVMNTKA